MNAFDDREKAFEKKFEYDQEIKFKIDSRSALLFGEWVAGQLGLKGAEAESYTKQVLDLIVTKESRNGLVKKVEQDFQAKGQAISAHRIERELEGFYLKAREQIISSNKS